MILALKSTGSTTHMCLFQSGEQVAKHQWESGRQLSEGLLGEIDRFLQPHGGLEQLSGLVVFRGPGSFTSLRISVATINSLAYALAIPNVGAEGDQWVEEGLANLGKQKDPQIVTPVYDREPNVTAPKK